MSCSTLMATRKRRVLSIQPVAEQGGSDHALIGLIRQLSSDGWECHVALPAESPIAEEFAKAGAHMHIVPMRRLTATGGVGHWIEYLAAWPVSVVRLVLLARRLEIGIVHTNSLHSWYGWAVSVALRRPHVWHAREIVVQSPAALRLERRLTSRYATVVIAVSSTVAAQLDRADGPQNRRRLGRPRRPESEVVVVFDEADASRFNPGRAGNFRQLLALSDNLVLVGMVGRVDTWKGFGVLLDAIPIVRAGLPLVQFVLGGPVVVGKEDYAADLAHRAGLLHGVTWLGARSDVAELMADLDLFVLASTDPEPFGLVITEALASGVPVVATAAGGPLELLANASAYSRLVAPGDPQALAEGIVDLLGTAVADGEHSSAARRRRKPLRTPSPPPFPNIFSEALDSRLRGPSLDTGPGAVPPSPPM